MKQFLLSTMLLSGMWVMNAQAKMVGYVYLPNFSTEVVCEDRNDNTATNKDAGECEQSLLPTDVIDITATTTETNGIVSWGSGHRSAGNTSYFVIERSFDGREFSALQSMPVKTSGSYSFTDAGVWNTTPGRVWYRLQIIDSNGNSRYSPIVELTGRP